MLNQLFPKTFDNQFRGHLFSLWLFAFIAATKVLLGLLAVFYPDGSSQAIVPPMLAVDTNLTAQPVNTMFAHLGLAQLSLGLLFLVVLVRYRSMIPLMYSLLLIEYLIEDGVASMQPLLAVLTPAAGDLALLLTIMGITGFVLSLRDESGLLPNS